MYNWYISLLPPIVLDYLFEINIRLLYINFQKLYVNPIIKYFTCQTVANIGGSSLLSPLRIPEGGPAPLENTKLKGNKFKKNDNDKGFV